MGDPTCDTDIGALVRQVRLTKGMSQEELADRCGLTERSIRNIERGLVLRPRVDSVRRIANALDMPADEYRRLLVAARDARRLGGARTRLGWPTPAQLPPRQPFSGRADELRRLHDLWSTRRSGGRGLTVVITGCPGVGKTALAVQWAYQARRNFPDGQLFVELGGADPQPPVPPGRALGYMLRALGVPADRVPLDIAEQVGLYRSLLADRSVLVVLDNACSSEQVVPLLPAATASVVVVTSRTRLDALAAGHGVVTLELDVLVEEDAARLLIDNLDALGDRLPADDTAHVRALATICDRLPLALRIATARLTTPPRPTITQLLHNLADSRQRLSTLSLENGALSVRAAFDTAHRTLRSATAMLFGRLAVHPGPHFGEALATAVGGADLATTRRQLHELTAAHLLVETTAGRYRFHDLVRLYAREKAPPAERKAVTRRILDWYLSAADSADRLVVPLRTRRPVLSAAHAVPVFHTQLDALTWWDAERENVLPLVREAVDSGHHEAAWQLPRLLFGSFRQRWGFAEHLEAHELALEAAQHTGDPWTVAATLSNLGTAHGYADSLHVSLQYHHRALALWQQLGDYDRLAGTYNNIGACHRELGHPDRALRWFERAIELNPHLDHEASTILATHNLATAWQALGRFEAAFATFAKALAICRRTGHDYYEAVTLSTLGEAHAQAGQYIEAAHHLRLALALHRRLGDKHRESLTLRSLGDVHIALAQPASAALALHTALTIRRSVPNAYDEAGIERSLGDLAAHLGDEAAAAAHRHRAVALYTVANAAEAHTLAALLNSPPARRPGDEPN